MTKRRAPLKCPRCQDDLHEHAIGGITIDICASCGGHWYDAGELETVRSQGPDQRPPGLPSVIPRWVDAPGKASQCPRCQLPLASQRYAYSSDLVLDRCTTCDGVWIDSGELERMDRLIAEWSQDVGKDAATWSAGLKEIEAKFGKKLDDQRRSTRLGAVVGFFFDLFERGKKKLEKA